jgi:hypothetical protein
MVVTSDDIKRYIEAMNPALGQVEKEGKQRPTRRTALNGGTPINDCPYETRIVSEDELVPFLNNGWDIVKELSGGRIIIRRPNHLDE